MKTMKKFKFTLANDIDKDEEWLTEMSAKGFHFYKYSWFFYHFEEDPSRSYIYQTDFQAADDEYFELYKETGWEHVYTEKLQFHYFRADKDVIGDQRIYSDPASVKGMYKRMLLFYLTIFFCMLLALTGLIVTWRLTLLSAIIVSLAAAVSILYIYLFIALLLKMRKYEKLT